MTAWVGKDITTLSSSVGPKCSDTQCQCQNVEETLWPCAPQDSFELRHFGPEGNELIGYEGNS